MGIFDSNSKKSTTNQTYNYDQKVAADAGSIGVSGSEDVTINTLDAGAITEAFNFGADAFAFGDETAGGAFDLAADVTGQAIDYGVDALGFGGDALQGSFGFGGDALNLIGGAFDRALNFGKDVVVQSGAQLASTTAQISDATRSDSADTLKTITKYGAGVLVAFIIFSAIKKGK